MLGERVDTAPGGDNNRVEEFLGAAGATEPQLANEHENGQENAVGDESAAHNKVGQALAEVVALTEALSRDTAKDQLCPDNDGKGFAANAVNGAEDGADTSVEALFEVQPKINAENDLGE